MKHCRHILLTVAAIVLTCLFVASGAAALSSAQQPREQGPPPATCQQVERENTAMRERIASLERQVDATNEEAKTFYLRAETWFDAYRSAARLNDHYRLEDAHARPQFCPRATTRSAPSTTLPPARTPLVTRKVYR